MRLKIASLFMIIIALLGIGFVVGGASVIHVNAAQDPTEQQQTVDAAVNQFFNQTATAEGRLNLTATAQAGVGLTATAAEVDRLIALTATIDAAFNDALTATAGVNPAMPTAADNGAVSVTLPPQSTLANLPPELANIVSPLVRIPAASFSMGTTPQEIQLAVRECIERDNGNCQLADGEDSVPPHQVSLSEYGIEVYEVSFQQYLAFLNSEAMGAGSHRSGCFGSRCVDTQNEEPNSYIQFDDEIYSVAPLAESLPVVNVTWFGANAYCAAIGRRLPTEAEWEYAARGAEGFLYPWGNTWLENRAKTNRPITEEVGAAGVLSFSEGASPFGLFNMAGNAAEWTNDWYDERYYVNSPAENPTGAALGEFRVVRGGSWNTAPFYARAVHRQFFRPERSSASIGFRCAEGGSGEIPVGVTATPNFDLTPSQTPPTETPTPTPR